MVLSNYVHAYTNMTAMLWSPNTGSGYPYGYPQSNADFPKANDPNPQKRADFLAMDTNNDGIISSLDDPYLPYW